MVDEKTLSDKPKSLNDLIASVKSVYGEEDSPDKDVDVEPQDEDVVSDEGVEVEEDADLFKQQDLPEDETAEDEKPEETKIDKFKSQEELIKAYKEAERKMHEATTTAKRYRAELEEAQKKLAELSNTGKESSDEEVSSKIAQVLKDISSLDPTEDDYESAAAKQWAKLFMELVPSISEQVVRKKAYEVIDEIENSKRREAEIDLIREKVYKMATDSGIDMRQGIAEAKDGTKINSPDYDLFVKLAATAQGDTWEEQAKWTINEVKRLKAAIGEAYIKAAEKGKEKQKTQPLGTTYNAPTGRIGKEEPMSLSDALKYIQSKRVV